MSGHSEEEIRATIRRYIMVGTTLFVLTVVTVAISYLQLPTVPAIVLALAVAVTKGALVALVFMHLIDEKQLIYTVLGLTVAGFFMVMWIPNGWDRGIIEVDSVYSHLPKEQLGGEHLDEHADTHGGEEDHGEAH